MLCFSLGVCFSGGNSRPRAGVRLLASGVTWTLLCLSLVEIVLFGIPAAPEVFVRKAVETGHPADFKCASGVCQKGCGNGASRRLQVVS